MIEYEVEQCGHVCTNCCESLHCEHYAGVSFVCLRLEMRISHRLTGPSCLILLMTLTCFALNGHRCVDVGDVQWASHWSLWSREVGLEGD